VGFGVPGCNALALCEVCAPPPPTGACCDGLACSIQTEADCDAAGDRYLGDGASCVGAAGTPTTYASGPVGTDIPDGDPAGISHIINVPDSFIMGDANVGVVIPHTWVGDLIITVEHNATVATIVDRMGAAGSGFGCPSNDLNIDLDDQGTGGAVEDLCGPSDADPTPTSPPNYVPNNPLSVFAGMDAAGDWTITVSDNAGFDTGVLDSWSLVLDRVGENPCIPHGACCLWPDSCADDTQDECLAQQGVYLGDDTVCVIPGPVQSYSADAGIDIPDGGGQGDSISHTINVPASLNIIDTDVDVVINHTWIGDLVISVEHNATTVVIVDQPGVPASVFGCNSNDLNIILDDTGTGGPVETLCGPSDASPTPTSPPNYGPNNPLSAFNGMDAAGPWTITVYDNADFDIGTLVSWSLHFATPGADACEDVAFLGACCNGNTGTCQDGVLEADCDGSLQTWYKVTLCDEIECEAVVGACCITQTGVCTDGVTQSACPGVWTQGALCSQVSCQPPPTGACCDRDLSVCTDGVTQANCTGEWSQGVLCANVDPPCISFVPIPTVSEWGLVVLSLLLLIGMKFYFGTRREAQSA
jgi:subtilisin-like proprotein convertase family protein